MGFTVFHCTSNVFLQIFGYTDKDEEIFDATVKDFHEYSQDDLTTKGLSRECFLLYIQ